MIDNPIIQVLVVLLFGFCLGILFTLWYMFRFLKIPIMEFAAALSARIKTTNISLKQLLRGITIVIDKSLEEIELESEKASEKDQDGHL